MKRLLTTYLAITDILAVAGTSFVLLLGGLQVWFRYMTDASLIWSEEAMRFTMLWLVMICGGRAYSARQFLGMRSLIKTLPTRIARLVDIASGMVMIGFLMTITWYGALFAWKTRLQVAPTIDVSLFWVHLAICIGPIILAVHILIEEVFGLKPDGIDEVHA